MSHAILMYFRESISNTSFLSSNRAVITFSSVPQRPQPIEKEPLSQKCNQFSTE